MEDYFKVIEYIDKVKKIKPLPLRISQKKAAELMGCSPRTVRRYAKICNVRLFEIDYNVWCYHLSGVQRLKLRREYNDYIRRFKKKSKAGVYGEDK